MISAAEYAAQLDPPRSKEQVLQWCRAKRIPGAKKNRRGEWRIPKDAVLKGAGRRQQLGTPSTEISALEFAILHGRSQQRVYQMLEMGRVLGAWKDEYGWHIPKGTPWPEDMTQFAVKARDYEGPQSHPNMPGSTSIVPER